MRLVLLGLLVAASVLVAGCSHPPGTSFNPSTWPPPSPPPPPPVTPLRPSATPTPAPTPTPAAATSPVSTPSPSPSAAPTRTGDVARGKSLFATSCAACHSPQQPFAPGKGTPVGPGLAGVSAKGEAYIRESIVEPGAKIAEGFAPAMPDFDRQLCGKKASSAADVADCQALDDLVAYLLSLQSP